MTTPQLDLDSGISRTPDSALARVRASLPTSFRETVRSGRQLASVDGTPATDSVLLPTAVDAVDRLLCGGLPRGRLVELTGRRSCGRFSTLLAALAATTQSGETVALVDLSDSLDPRTAEATGIDLRRLLWIRPADVKAAMISAELTLHAGFSLVAVELGIAPVSGSRHSGAGWVRLARAAAEHQAALFVSSPHRVSCTAATTVLTAEEARPIWYLDGRAPRLLAGLRGRFSINKSRLAVKRGAESFRFSTAAGRLAPVPAPPKRDNDIETGPCRQLATL